MIRAVGCSCGDGDCQTCFPHKAPVAPGMRPRPWVVTALRDCGPSHFYRWRVDLVNYSRYEAGEVQSWAVPDLASESYDLSAVAPELAEVARVRRP